MEPLELTEEELGDIFCQRCGSCGISDCCPPKMCYDLTGEQVPENKEKYPCLFKDDYIRDMLEDREVFEDAYNLLKWIAKTTNDVRTKTAVVKFLVNR